MPAKKTYTITEAAKRLGISRQAVHEAIKKGLLEAEQVEVVQSVWQIPAQSLKTYRVSQSHKQRGEKNLP
jgi:excisionase family DNA binding protein